MEVLYILLAVIISGIICSITVLLTNIKNTSGEIVMFEDSMYLNINNKDLEKFADGSIIKIRVKRRNFKGFNE